MSEVLVLVEQHDGAIAKVTGELLAAAARLGEPAAVVVGKPGTADALATELGALGEAKVYAAEAAEEPVQIEHPVRTESPAVAPGRDREPPEHAGGEEGPTDKARGPGDVPPQLIVHRWFPTGAKTLREPSRYGAVPGATATWPLAPRTTAPACAGTMSNA